MCGDKASGEADNQQGSRQSGLFDDWLTPQRLHAELLASNEEGLKAYLQGALRDGTRSQCHGTYRFGQSDRRWVDLLSQACSVLGFRSWVYQEGRSLQQGCTYS
jgi:hypothetical protein